MADKITPRPKTLFITGGTTGIGLATAQLFLENGYNVFIFSNVIPKNAGIQALQSDPYCLIAEGDIRDAKAVRAAIAQALRRFKRIDLLINNAAVALCKPLLQTTKREMDFILEVNIRGTLTMTQEMLKAFVKQGFGMVINISSGAGTFGIANLSVYSLTKAAIINLSQSLSQEFKGTALRFLTVTPGSTDTAMFRQCFPDDAPHHSPADVARIIYRAAQGELQPNDQLVIDTFYHER